jgi:hypothetical protein
MTIRYFAIVLGAIFLLLSTQVVADTLTFDTSIEFSGGTPPSGAPPWMRAVFDDGGGSGSVMLTLSNLGLVDMEFVSEWDFNLDPALDPTALVFSAPTKVGMFMDPTISTGTDAFQANGDGKYDIQFAFSVSGMMGGALRFGAGESMELTISGIPSLTASSFDFLSAPMGGHGPFPTAAHVQGIGPTGEDSGWVTVPEPSSLLLVTLYAICAFGALRRRTGL